jgi:cysteine desulfurase/selenocysteine lyase
MNGGDKMNREDFPMLKKDYIYFDNGATTFKPMCVIDEINNYYMNLSVNAHRGDYDLSIEVDNLYESTRNEVKSFINAKRREEIIFTKGTTESMNMIVFGFMKNYLKPGDEVLITKTEHASNVLPWFTLEKELGIKVNFIPLENLEVTLDNVKKSINPNTKVISIAWVTNTIGDVRNIKEICKLAHENNILMVVDGAQAVGHMKTDVSDLDIDFLAFSAHKMLGPTGVGVLYGKYDYLNKMLPINYGGGMNHIFESDKTLVYKELPLRLEAGTMNISGILSFRKAINYLNNIGLDKIEKHEQELKEYLVNQLKDIDNVTIYNPNTKSGIVLFNIDGIFSEDAGRFLNHYHICVRAGNHCAKMVKDEIGISNTCRVSLYLYNTKEEIDKFIEVMKGHKDIFKVII